MEARLERNTRHGLWARRALAAAILGLVVAGGVAVWRRLTVRREEPPAAEWSAKAPAQARLIAGASGLVAVWPTGDGVRIARLPGGESIVLAPGNATVAMGDGVIVACDGAAGVLKYAALDGSGALAAGSLKAPGIVAGAGDRKGFTVAVVNGHRDSGAGTPGAGGSSPGEEFTVRRLDAKGRVAWEKEFEGIPLTVRAWPGLAVVAALQVREYPFTTLIAVRENVCLEYKAIPGLARSVEVYPQGGLLVSLSGTCVYAHDSAGRLVWSIEPGGLPADAAPCERGVVVAVGRETRGGLLGLFARDFAALYDKDGARLWKADVPPGASCVKTCGDAALVGTSTGVTAIDLSGSTRWELKTPAPVKSIEVSADGSRFYVLTNAGEITAYRIERQAGGS